MVLVVKARVGGYADFDLEGVTAEGFGFCVLVEGGEGFGSGHGILVSIAFLGGKTERAKGDETGNL